MYNLKYKKIVDNPEKSDTLCLNWNIFQRFSLMYQSHYFILSLIWSLNEKQKLRQFGEATNSWLRM